MYVPVQLKRKVRRSVCETGQCLSSGMAFMLQWAWKISKPVPYMYIAFWCCLPMKHQWLLECSWGQTLGWCWGMRNEQLLWRVRQEAINIVCLWLDSGGSLGKAAVWGWMCMRTASVLWQVSRGQDWGRAGVSWNERWWWSQPPWSTLKMSSSSSWTAAWECSASCCWKWSLLRVLDADIEYLPSWSFLNSWAERGSVVSVRKSQACSGMTKGGSRRWVGP